MLILTRSFYGGLFRSIAYKVIGRRRLSLAIYLLLSSQYSFVTIWVLVLGEGWGNTMGVHAYGRGTDIGGQVGSW